MPHKPKFQNWKNQFNSIALLIILLLTAACSKQKSQSAVVSATPTPIPVSTPTPNPTPTQSAEDKARFDKILAKIEASRRKDEEEDRKREMEYQKNKYCVAQKQLVQYGQPLSQQCIKRLADLRREANKPISNTPPDDSWLDKP